MTKGLFYYAISEVASETLLQRARIAKAFYLLYIFPNKLEFESACTILFSPNRFAITPKLPLPTASKNIIQFQFLQLCHCTERLNQPRRF